MVEINPFVHVSLGVLLYFNYGLAYIFLGVAIVAKNMSGSKLKIVMPLRYLAIFGFTHGTLEWLELYRVFQGNVMSPEQVLTLKTLGLFFGIVSFLFLIQFGLTLMHATIAKKNFNWFKVFHFFMIILWVTIIGLIWIEKKDFDLVLIKDVEIVTRYCLAFFGSIFSAL